MSILLQIETNPSELELCGNHFLAIVMIAAIIWKPAYRETAQRLKSPRPLNFFGSDHKIIIIIIIIIIINNNKLY